MTQIDAAMPNFKKSAQSGKLVAVIGTGVSMALTNGRFEALSWKGLVANGFAYGVTKGKITPEQRRAWETQLSSNDIDDLLSAAEFMGRKLESPKGDLYARWLESVFKEVVPENKEMADAVRALHALGVPICTLNYDPLLERVTGMGSINIEETVKVAEWMRRENQAILHLHGVWDAPATCILGIRDYNATVNSEVRDLIQRNLGSFSRLLFIGCGDTFADPNFSALIQWLREKMKTAAPQHYALVPADDEGRRHKDPSWLGFVEPISYGVNRQELPAFLLKHFSSAGAKAPRKAPRSKQASPAEKHARILEEYVRFLLGDCGQMTIEGMRADMHTAQRRFDLERLFVPLNLLATPPEFPPGDPQSEEKLIKWLKKNGHPVSFGEVFAKHRRLALLALPGGGKTLLLKRLAVAYADSERRKASDDNLPDLDLLPVMIRCREWKEYIRRPIPILLQNISAITGIASLAGFYDALIPLLKNGRVLLLVDGLDEIHSDADRSTFVDHLEAFLTEFKLARLVVSSREAGFNLVAPSIARFCERWRVAPLEEGAIAALCDHWHHLMTGVSPEALTEARDVSNQLLSNDSLHRLAENPLLLTMLLVVKHGAGRLPPDRVSLYGRAVEVLLDTWNIKGHDALKLKEAVPQLACVAFELMRKGKQTATEKEVLAILEEARERVPQIRRYAEDTPDRFLKRVELRSSLLVESGHQLDRGYLVPFYQFRHLTFQEYLAAVAAVEGYYLEYKQGDTILTPLAPYLTAEEWKEVIPMAAVLARKQAEPVLAELVKEGNLLRHSYENGGTFEGEEEWSNSPYKLPAPIARLVQCLVEEADASPETVTGALQLTAFFGRGCRSPDSWPALSCGAYGGELIHQTWLLYAPMQTPFECHVRNTFARLASYRKPRPHWESKEGQDELISLLRGGNAEDVTCGLLTIAGFFWGQDRSRSEVDWVPLLLNIEEHLFDEDPAVWVAAAWAWARVRGVLEIAMPPPPVILDRLLSLCTSSIDQRLNSAVYALSRTSGFPRSIWQPKLTEQQRLFVQQNIDGANNHVEEAHHRAIASLVVAFHSRSVLTDPELVDRLSKIKPSPYIGVNAMLQELGEVGRKLLLAREEQQQKRRRPSI